MSRGLWVPINGNDITPGTTVKAEIVGIEGVAQRLTEVYGTLYIIVRTDDGLVPVEASQSWEVLCK